MRRFLYTLALSIVVVLSLYIHGPALKHEANAWVAQQRLRRNVDNAIRSTAYTISHDRWIEFLLPPQTVALRVLTNAAVMQPDLPPDNPDRPRRGWRYAIRYELRADDHKLLVRQDYHLRTKITQYEDPVSGKVQGVTWFRDSDKIPTQTRTIQLPLNADGTRPTMIRMRLADCDVEIADVVARVYIKYERSNYEQPYVWSRLSSRRRERLARASVYPADLLSPTERKNLLRWNWAALPPVGRVDIDYVQRQMYQQEDPQPDAAEFLPSAEGIACRPNFPITIPIPPEPGTVTLDFVPVESTETPDSATVTVRYFLPVHGLIWEERTSPGQFATFERPANGGMYEIVASEKMICSARWTASSDHESQITGSHVTETQLVAATELNDSNPSHAREPPDADSLVLSSSGDRVRYHLAMRDGTLCYTITHVDEFAAPIRFSLRRLVMPGIDDAGRTIWPTQLEKGQLHYTWLDALGAPIRTGYVETSELITPYDTASMGTSTLASTESISVYFALPKQVVAVRLYSETEDIAVAAFTRPPGLPRTFRLPEEDDAYRMPEDLGRTWFLLRPDDFGQRIMGNRFATVQSQTRPPEINEQLVSGEYEWQDIAPTVETPGRFVLTLRDPQLLVRDETRGLIYHALAANRDVSIRWHFDDFEAATTPRLVYRSDRHVDQPVEIWLDGKLFHRFQPRSTRGEIELPQVAATTESSSDDRSPAKSTLSPTHRLQIVATQPMAFWIRGVAAADELPQNVKRFVYQIGEEPLEFPVRKLTHETEHVIVRPFFNADVSNVQRQRLEVNVLDVATRPAGPLAAWTLTNRLFDILPVFDPPAWMLGGTDLIVDQGQRCLVVLGEDLPPGDYRLRVRWATASDDHSAHLSVYRLLPALQSKRSLSVDAWSNEMASFDPLSNSIE